MRLRVSEFPDFGQLLLFSSFFSYEAEVTTAQNHIDPKMLESMDPNVDILFSIQKSKASLLTFPW